jgi:hypothetical protein
MLRSLPNWIALRPVWNMTLQLVDSYEQNENGVAEIGAGFLRFTKII